MPRVLAQFVFPLFFFPFILFGQTNRKLLEANRLSIENRINKTSNLLEKILEYRNDKLTEIKGLNSQILEVGRLLEQINEEILVIDLEISESEDVIFSIGKDLGELKQEYAAMLYSTYKSNNDDLERLSFIFSSKSIGQMFSRLSYFKQYDEYRQYQIGQIKATMEVLEKRQISLETKRTDKKYLQKSLERRKRGLIYMKNKKRRLVKELLEKEGMLKAQMEIEENALDMLQEVTYEAIIRHISTDFPFNTSTEKFENLRGSLPWPVKEGFISRRFGNQPHPIYEHIWDDNPGVYIATEVNEKVLAVFPGKVIAVSKPPGSFYYVVTVQHQRYFTNYHRLKNISVEIGQEIVGGAILGEVAESEGGLAELLFEVWENLEKQDPEEWLMK